MGVVTPNIGIYIPAAGETNYDASFAAGMVNIDQHDHSGGPNKGVPITSSGIADGSITFNLLNPNVADNATGIGTEGGAQANTLTMLGILKNLYQLVAPVGFIAANGATVAPRTITGTANQIAVSNGAGVAGNPTLSLSPIVVNSTQPAFLASADVQNGVTGDNTNAGAGTLYPVTFTLSSANNFDQGSNFSSSSFTCPVTGIYLFDVSLGIGNISAAGANGNNICEVAFVVTTGFVSVSYKDFNMNLSNVANSGNGATISSSQICHCLANDVVTITLQVGSNQVPLNINILDGRFSGTLIC